MVDEDGNASEAEPPDPSDADLSSTENDIDGEEDLQEQSSIQKKGSRRRNALKRLCQTRWEEHLGSLDALYHSYGDVLGALKELEVNDPKPEVRQRAKGLRSYFSKLETVFVLITEYQKLLIINPVSKALQCPSIELGEAVRLLSKAVERVSDIKVVEIRREALQLARSVGIPCEQNPCDTTTTARRVSMPCSRFRDFETQEAATETQNRHLPSSLDKFIDSVIKKDLQLTVEELQTRFQATLEAHKLFVVLNPTELLAMTDEEVLGKSADFLEKYEKDFSKSLGTQLLSAKRLFSEELSEMGTSFNFLKHLLDTRNMFGSSFTELISALVLFLTLPVSVAQAERSFSKLKLIKNYLRTKMDQERLSNLALMSIERQRALQVDKAKVVDRFFQMKKRRYE